MECMRCVCVWLRAAWDKMGGGGEWACVCDWVV